MKIYLILLLNSGIFLMLFFIENTFLTYSYNSNYDDNYRLSKRTKQLIRVDALINEGNKLKELNPDLFFEINNEALKASIKAKYSRGEAATLTNIGSFYLNGKKYNYAYEFFNLAINKIQESSDYKLQHEIYNGIGQIFKALKRYDRAILYFSKTYQLCLNHKELALSAVSYGYVGQIMLEQNKKYDALRYFFYALYLSEKEKNNLSQRWLLKNLGNYYLSCNNYKRAIYYYTQAVNIPLPNYEKVDFGTYYSLIAHAMEMNKNYSKAFHFNRLALEIRTENKQKDGVASSLLNIGHTFLLSGNLDSAVVYLEEGTKLASTLKKYYLTEYGYNDLKILFTKKEEWKNAFITYNKYIVAKDSLLSEKTRNDISIFETNQILNDQEKKNALLEKENFIQKLELKNKNVLIIFFIIFLITVILTAVYFYFQNRKNRKEKIIQQEFNQKLAAHVENRLKIEEDLKKNELQYHFITDHSADIISRVDSKFRRRYVSPSCEKLFGYSPEEMVSMNDPSLLMHPDFIPRIKEQFREMVEYREQSSFVYKAIRKDGTWFWAESNVNPIFDETTGELSEMIAVLRDISERVDAQEALAESAKQKEILMHEVHHRVKNNFAILSSLTSMHKELTSDENLRRLLDDLQFRIRTMALVHEQLYRTRSIDELIFGDYLHELVKIISTAFKKDNVEVSTECLAEYLNVDMILPLGLIVNELLTNAYKYAFTDGREGMIQVIYEASPRKDSDGKEFRQLTVKDNGVGFPEDFSSAKNGSLGTEIIQILSRQLEAEISVENRNGVSFSIIFPAGNNEIE